MSSRNVARVTLKETALARERNPPRLASQEDRELALFKNGRCYAPKDPLKQPGMAVGAHYDHVAAHFHCMLA